MEQKAEEWIDSLVTEEIGDLSRSIMYHEIEDTIIKEEKLRTLGKKHLDKRMIEIQHQLKNSENPFGILKEGVPENVRMGLIKDEIDGNLFYAIGYDIHRKGIEGMTYYEKTNIPAIDLRVLELGPESEE